MTINTHRLFSTLLSTLLIIALVAPSLLPLTVSAQAQTDSPENASNRAGDPGEGDGESEAEADADGDGESDSAESAASEAAAAEVSEVASIAGVDVSVNSVDTKADPNAKGGTSVSVNGVSMSVESAISAIGAIADARDTAGLNVSYSSSQPGVDVGATLSAHAMGDTGVVGKMSSEFGTATDVAKAESEHAGRQAAVGYAASFNESRFGNTAAPMASANLSQALSQVAQNAAYVANEIIGVTAAQANTNTNTVTIGTKTHVTDDTKAFAAYTEAVAPAKAAATEAYKSLEAAYAKNDEAAIEAAETAMANAAESMKSVAQSHFGVSAVSVSLSGADGGTGSGTSVGTPTGVSSSQQPNTTTTGTSGNNTNATYSYDSKTATFLGYESVANDTKSELAGAGNIAATVSGRAGTDTVTTVNTAKDVVSTFNTQTGNVQSFDYSGKETSGFASQSGLSGGSNLSPTGTGGYTVANVQPTTPATDLVTGKTEVGAVPGKLQEAAQAHGYNLDSPATVLALGYVYEVDPRTRAAIINAYEQSQDFSTLSNAAVEEVTAILGAIAGEAARTNRTIAQQIAKPAYLSSVTVDAKAFGALRDERTREALSAFAEKITDGSLSSARGLNVTVPVANSNHFHAAYVNPSWSAKMANPTEVGQYTKTVVGYIPSEINPAGEGARAAAVRSPALVSPNSMVQNIPGFTITVKGPSPALLASDLQNVSLPAANSYAPVADTAPAVAAIDAVLAENFVGRVHPVNGGPTRGNSATYGPRTRIGSGGKTYASTHRGTDIYGNDLKEDRDVSSVANGTVEYLSRNVRGYGTVIDIRNDETGIVSRYTHVDPVDGLAVGSTVNVGQVIARISGVGTDFGKAVAAIQERDGVDKDTAFNAAVDHFTKNGWGSVTPPHLHYEERSCSGCYGAKGIQDSTASLGYEKGSSYIGGTSLSTAAGTQPAVTSPNTSTAGTPPATAVTSASPVKSAVSKAPGVVGRLTTRVQNTLVKAGIPKNSPIVRTVAPIVSAIAIYALVPTPAILAAELISRNKTLTTKIFPGGTSTTPQTPPAGGGVDSCVDKNDPTCPKPQQGAAVWMSINNNDLLISLLEKLWPIPELPASINEKKQATIDSGSTIKVPVTITVNMQTSEVELSREDILETLEEYQVGEDITEEDAEMARYEQYEDNPILFGDDGEIIYSDGLYAPIYEDGFMVENQTTQYVYIVKYIDEFGQAVEPTANDNILPENFISKAIRNLLSSSSEFVFDDVEVVTYRLIDPDRKVLRDEYYDYVVRLKNGEVRAITIPQYTSVAFMKERFTSIGYRGEVLGLIGLAYETLEKPTSLFRQAVTATQDYIEGFFDTEQPTDSLDQVTELPIVSSGIRAADISGIFIYPLADVDCPVIEGSSSGFAYNVVVKDRANPDQVTVIADARCGTGDAAALTEETARHLSEKYGISDMTYSTAIDKTTIRFEPIIHSSGVFTANIGDTTSDIELPDEPTADEPTATSSTTLLPNLTNTISFEVKAVGNDGQVLKDWTSAETISVSQGAQLYFRWNGSDYQQCLPFLNDNGNYSLTVRNRAMTSGNTENEGYNISERSAVYRIECGGQRNNEFGVDDRSIEVTVE